LLSLFEEMLAVSLSIFSSWSCTSTHVCMVSTILGCESVSYMGVLGRTISVCVYIV
jgi:hypothetical protein